MEVILQKLTLHYFKGAQNLEIKFSFPVTVIQGANGTRKTTISDAWHWLLFGKDSFGRAVKTPKSDGFELKTLTENNEVIPSVDHEVIGELLCNGRLVTLRKVYREDWVKPSGALESVLKGHTNVCYFDGIPVAVGEYERRVNDIIPEALFKLITNPAHYNSLHWLDRRNVLMTMAGDVKDAEVAILHPEFASLLASLEGKTIADFKAKIGAEKGVIKKQLDAMPTKIATVREGMAIVEDWKAIQSEIDRLQSEINSIDTSIGNASEAYRIIYDGVQKTQGKINTLKTLQQGVIQNAKTAEQNRVFESNKQRRELEQQIDTLNREARQAETTAGQLAFERDQVQSRIDKLVIKTADLRTKFLEVNAREYVESKTCLVCPAYGHECTDGTALQHHYNESDKARNAFNKAIIEEIASINEEGKQHKATIELLTKSVEKYNQDIKAQNTLKDDKIELLRAKRLELENTPVEHEKIVAPETLLEWAEAEQEIKELEDTLTDLPKVDNSELIAKKSGISAELDRLKKLLNTKEQIEKDERRISEYQEEQQILSQKIADLEAQEYEAMRFTKAKFSEVENRVNSKFEIVKFKMFNYTIDGNEVECCETLIDGVPYATANTAGKINAGIDIINALSEFHGCYAPIFIDNRESVNNLIDSNSQIINLIVTTDKSLVITK